VQVPLRITQEQVAYFEAADPAAYEPDVFPIWIWHQIPHAYGIPTFGLPGPKVALHGAGPEVTPETRTFEPDPGYATAVESFVREHLPSAFGPILEIRTCQYARTPDDDFVLDLIPGQTRAAFALGTAHAFKFSSAIGRALVDLVLDGGSDWRLPRFAADRPGLAV
jgi:sarcosine oxidase